MTSGLRASWRERAAPPPAVLLLFLLLPLRAAGLDFGLDGGAGGGGFPATLRLPAAPLLKASLIAYPERPAPGHPFRILLELEHQSGAYSYWVNPGGPGLAARASWRLPAGFSISDPAWPAPELYVNSGIVSHVLKGRAALVYTVTPPPGPWPDGGAVLAAELETQVCTAKSCLPTRLSLTIVVKAAAGEAAGAPGEAPRALARLPRPAGDWRPEAEETADGWLLTLPGGPPPGEAHFFEDGEAGFLVDSQKPQLLETRDGSARLLLPRLEGAAVLEAPLLSGVLRLGGGRERPAGEAFSLRLAAKPAAQASLSPAAPPLATAGLPFLLALAFLGGLVLNVMPCVFPVIGLKILGFAKQAHQDRRRILLHGLAYAGGTLLCFWGLAALVMGLDSGWGAHLQSPWFLFPVCHLFVILSMNLAGTFQVGAAPAGGLGAAGSGWRRSFLSGLLATLTATPCSAPFLGAALAYALTAPALLSFLLFTAMGLGFSSPYVALAACPGLLKRLPKPGPWMERLRQGLSFPMFAAAAYLAWTLEAMLSEWRFLALLIGLVLTALACWLYGLAQESRGGGRRWPRFWRAAALASLAAGVWMGLPGGEAELRWEEWSPEAVARLRNAGRPVYVDFTARWCATCQINKRIWTDSELRELALRKGVALLKADWTRYDDRITTVLRREFDRAAVPVNVLYAPGEEKGRVFPELLTAAGVKGELAGLGGP